MTFSHRHFLLSLAFFLSFVTKLQKEKSLFSVFFVDRFLQTKRRQNIKIKYIKNIKIINWLSMAMVWF